MSESRTLEVAPFEALAPEHPVDLDDVVRRTYGHALEEFVPGTVFLHPRGITLDRGAMLLYATTFMEACPLYLNERFARSQGYAGLPAAPHMVMNLALSLGVQNDSEQAIANLGYYDVRFLRPVVAGDTLMGRTRVIARRDRGPGKPGIVTVETLATNQHGHVVIQYRRKIFVPRRSDAPIDPDARVTSEAPFPWQDPVTLHIPQATGPCGLEGVTLAQSLADQLAPGRIFAHRNGRTITDAHMDWTYRVMNTHPLHVDRLYAAGLSGPMSGEPIVYGGLVFAWLLGLASRDVTENAVWELGFHDGYHTQPAISGDTLGALTRVLTRTPSALGDSAVARVRMQLVGVKNLPSDEALARYGGALFERESEKRSRGEDKIPEKIFEIEREVLIRTELP